jgi:IS5 family transposase
VSKIRCKDSGLNSFHGDFLYDQTVSKGHFLRKLNEIVDWARFTRKLLKYYHGRGEIGQSPYDPVLILKMLLLSYLFNISERQVEEVVNDSLSAKCFAGLAANESAPDHATLTVFKNRLIEVGGMKVYEELFDEIIKIAQEKGVKFGKLQVVDSVHLVADVNIGKDRQRQKDGEHPRDRDARWGAKGSRTLDTPKGKEKRVHYFYGFKDQVSLNAGSEIVTSVVPGWADDYDGHKFKKLVEQDLRKGMPVGIVTADKGYDDGDNHYYLERKGISSAIILNRRRTEKRDKHKEGWLALLDNPDYQQGIKERYKVERKFGEARKWHSFMRCRYLGFRKHSIQSYFTFMALNLKRLVKLLTGCSLHGNAKPILAASRG